MSDKSCDLDILMITWRRPRYTELALRRLLATCETGMRVWVWHNGDDQRTLDVVSSLQGHPHLATVHISRENKKLREPTNWFWRNAKAQFLSKVDDDCLLPDGWANTLISAHRQESRLGIVGCWRFYDEDFVPELAERKIRQIGNGQRIMLNCWVQGSGYVMKRALFEELAYLRSHESFTDYGIRSALSGWINGWYYPFIHEEHMDDPRSPYSELQSEEDFSRRRPLSAINDNVGSLEEWKRRGRWMATSVQGASCDPFDYVGWRAKLRRGLTRLRRKAGWKEPWRMTDTERTQLQAHLVRDP